VSKTKLFTKPAAREAQTSRTYVLQLFSKNIFSDFRQTNYLNIYWTDLHQICRIGRPLAVEED